MPIPLQSTATDEVEVIMAALVTPAPHVDAPIMFGHTDDMRAVATTPTSNASGTPRPTPTRQSSKPAPAAGSKAPRRALLRRRRSGRWRSSTARPRSWLPSRMSSGTRSARRWRSTRERN